MRHLSWVVKDWHLLVGSCELLVTVISCGPGQTGNSTPKKFIFESFCCPSPNLNWQCHGMAWPTGASRLGVDTTKLCACQMPSLHLPCRTELGTQRSLLQPHSQTIWMFSLKLVSLYLLNLANSSNLCHTFNLVQVVGWLNQTPNNSIYCYNCCDCLYASTWLLDQCVASLRNVHHSLDVLHGASPTIHGECFILYGHWESNFFILFHTFSV